MPILVIHPGALGDVLQAVPALVALRSLPAGDGLAFAGQPRLGRLLKGTGVVDEALPVDGLGLEALFAGDSVPSEVKSRLARFDRIVSWFGAREELFAERLRSIVPATLVAPPVPETGPPPTVWGHLLATLAPWGVKPPERAAPLDVPEAWRTDARLALSRLGRDERRRLLVVHPGAGGRDKRWPAERFARVTEEVHAETGCGVVIHQGPADRGAVEDLLPLIKVPAQVLREPSLEVLAGVLQEASAYLGGDSGVSHLAAAVGTPSVILFPPPTRGRWAPWSPTARALMAPTGSEGVEGVMRSVIESLGRRV